jgi:hypothetical protein
MPCFCEKEFFNTTRHFAHQRSMSSMAMFQQVTVELALWLLASTAHQDVTLLTDGT